MARLQVDVQSSDDELPELSKILQQATISTLSNHASTRRTGQCLPSPTNGAQPEGKSESSPRAHTPPIPPPASRGPAKTWLVARASDFVTLAQASYSDGQLLRRAQRPLRLAHVNSLLLPVTQEAKDDGIAGRGTQTRKLSAARNAALRSSPRKHAKQAVNYGIFGHWSDCEEEEASDREGGANTSDFDGFIVNGDGELSCEDTSQPNERHAGAESHRKSKQPGSLVKGPVIDIPEAPELEDKLNSLAHEVAKFESAGPTQRPDLLSKVLLPHSSKSHKKHCQNPEWNEFDDSDAILKFSPPQSRSPVKVGPSGPGTAIITPPSSPSKPRLQSPSRHRSHIPQSPQRPSIDAFWAADIVNDWNDQYSPKKTPHSNQRKGLFSFLIYSSDEDDNCSLKKVDSPMTSPRKPNPAKETPRKPIDENKRLAAKRKAFDGCKHSMSRTFLDELDSKVAGGRLGVLAASTGGVKIIWSRNLRSTAGRASWRRTVLKSSDGTEKSVQHHASIELAEKVIDDEDRLINTLAHEFCHLTNFMISNVKDNPHGQSFKDWAHKVTSVFEKHPQYMNVRVTTKHSYAINHKYLWMCKLAGCATEYGRHSKSIDPVKHRCGKCKGSLIQVRPKPRGGAKSPMKKGAKNALQTPQNEEDVNHKALDMKTLEKKLEVFVLDA